jgi:hypothetical protein
MGGLYVLRLCSGSLGWGYLRELLVAFLMDILSFFYIPYTTSFILFFILWFSLVLLVPSLRLGNSSTLLSCPSPSSCPSPCLPTLHVTYLNPFFNYPVDKVVSS